MSERDSYPSGVPCWVDGARLAGARLGGKVIVAPHDTPGFRSAVLADPQGPVFSVSQLTARRR